MVNNNRRALNFGHANNSGQTYETDDTKQILIDAVWYTNTFSVSYILGSVFWKQKTCNEAGG